MMEEILKEAGKKMEEVFLLVKNDLKTIKTGRAKPSLIEDLKVRTYGAIMNLKELGSISAMDSHCLVVSPWDKTILKEIEKAIMASSLHLTATIDNNLIRVKIPPLTEETRKELVKLVYQKLESARRLARQVRNETKNKIEELKGEAGISEDDIKHGLDELQKLNNDTIAHLESLGKDKEKELMTV